MRAIEIAIVTVAWVFVSQVTLALQAQKPPEVSVLFRELQSPQKSNQATEELLKLGKFDPQVEHYLAIQLPPVIEKSPQEDPEVWNNAVRLAGELKIVKAATALTKWIGLGAGTVTMTQFVRLETNPAA